VRPSFDCGAHAGATGADNYYVVLVVVRLSSVFVQRQLLILTELLDKMMEVAPRRRRLGKGQR
jgi:adenine-specific DNA methylase